MAEVTENQDNPNAAPELAPNNWFMEYGMPFTNTLLEGEAEMNAEQGHQGERHDLMQFIIDQETAVAKDYLNGDISEQEFNDFKEFSENRLESLQEAIGKEVEELEESGEEWQSDFVSSLEAFGKEHNSEVLQLVEISKERDLEASDLSLHLISDAMKVGVDGIDQLYEILPPHLHDIVDVLEVEVLETAHDMVDARAELSSADEHNLDGDRAELEAIEPTVEAEFDAVHESIDTDFERIDVEIERAKEFVDTAQEHAELDPETTVEHMPYQTIEDYDLMEQTEEETGGAA